LQLRLDNEPLPDNPRTSALAALNAAFLVCRELSGLDF
jgi:predicted dinucleotide-utilizing enzyme